MDEIMFYGDANFEASSEMIMVDRYADIVAKLEEAKNEITLNWEGDTSDINDIVARIDLVVDTFKNKIGPAVTKLGRGAYYISRSLGEIASADAKTGVKAVANAETGDTGSSGESSSKPGFWAYHGQDFANDWDYSGCDSGLDYIGATVSGAVGTVGSAVNFVVDGASEILGWLFG